MCKILVGILLDPQDLLMLRDGITLQISMKWGYFNLNFSNKFIYSYIPYFAVAVSNSELKPTDIYSNA